MRHLLYSAFIATSIVTAQLPAAALSYPSKPVDLIIPFAPGGSTDTIGRLLAGALEGEFGVPVVVHNRAGGGATIGAAIVAQAAPDGYTLLLATPNQTINESLRNDLKYSLRKDFRAVGLVAESPSILLVGPSVTARNLEEFIAQAKAHPGAMTYASSGDGSSAHLTAELFKKAAGVDLLHVPYRGAAPAVTDTLAGRVDMVFGFTAGVIPQVQAGKLRPLAVTSTERIADLPNVPTMVEAGLEKVSVMAWYGVVAPAGTPDAVVERLNTVIAGVVPKIADRLNALGATPATRSVEAFAELIAEDIARWHEAIAFSKAGQN